MSSLVSLPLPVGGPVQFGALLEQLLDEAGV
jgi:hypothetical protein